MDYTKTMMALGTTKDEAEAIGKNPNPQIAKELAIRAIALRRDQLANDEIQAAASLDVRSLPNGLAGAIRSTYSSGLASPAAAQNAPVFYAEHARAAIERMRTLGQLPGSTAQTLRKTGVTAAGTLNLAFGDGDLPVNISLEAPAIRLEFTVAGTGSPSEVQISVSGNIVGQTAQYTDIVRANPEAGRLGAVYYVPGLPSVFGVPRRYPLMVQKAQTVLVPANAFGAGVPAAPVQLPNTGLVNQPPFAPAAVFTGLPDGTPCALEVIAPGSRYWEEFLATVAQFAGV